MKQQGAFILSEPDNWDEFAVIISDKDTLPLEQISEAVRGEAGVPHAIVHGHINEHDYLRLDWGDAVHVNVTCMDQDEWQWNVRIRVRRVLVLNK